MGMRCLSSRRSPARCEHLEPRTLWNVVPAGTNVVANELREGSQLAPQLASDAAGNFVVVWSSGGDAGEIRARLFNAAGQPSGAEFRVDTPGGSAFGPDVAMDDDGDFVIAWTEQSQARGRNVFVRRFNAAGVAQGEEYNPRPPGATTELPGIAMDADGSFALTYRIATATPQVVVDLHDSQGNRLDSDLLRSGESFATSPAPGSVAMDAAGNVTAVWTEFAGGNSTAFFQRFTADGTPRGPAARVFDPVVLTPAAGTVDVAMNDAGATVITVSTVPGVYARVFGADGAPRSGRIEAGMGLPRTLDGPVAVAPDGSFVVGFVRTDSSTSSGVPGSRARCFDADGSARGDEFVLSDVGQVTSLAPTPGGGLVAAFSALSPTGVPGDYDVNVRRFVPASKPTAIDRVYVNGAAWTDTFRDHLAATGVGSSDFGYAAGGVPNPLPMTWNNLDQLSIAFTRDVSLEPDDLRVTGARSGLFRYDDFDYDAQRRVATWTFDRNVPVDRLSVALDAPNFNYTFGLNVLPGDLDRNGRVNALDLAATRARLGTSPARPFSFSMGIYEPRADFNGDARINALELAAVRRNLNQTLPGAAVAAGLFASKPILG